MAIKMNDLVQMTDTPKSTILYYVKEGLLPEPQKPKPNVHLYDERCVEIIRFIKYLQKHFDTSIGELKAIMAKGSFDPERGFEAVFATLDVIMGAAYQKSYTFDEVCVRCGLDASALRSYLDAGLLFERDGVFTDKELEILDILRSLEGAGIDATVLQAYVAQARALARFEVDMAQKLLAQSHEPNRTIRALFDTTLILKPYLFNMHTLRTYQTQGDAQ